MHLMYCSFLHLPTTHWRHSNESDGQGPWPQKVCTGEAETYTKPTVCRCSKEKTKHKDKARQGTSLERAARKGRSKIPSARRAMLRKKQPTTPPGLRNKPQGLDPSGRLLSKTDVKTSERPVADPTPGAKSH